MATAGLALLVALVPLRLPAELAVAAGILAGLLTWCAIVRPVAMLVLSVAAEVVNLPGVAAGLGVPGVFQALLILAAVALVTVLRREQARQRIGHHSWLCTALLLVYLATQTSSIMVTSDLAATVTAVDQRAVDCLFLIILLMLAVATDSGWRVAGAVVVPLALLSAVSVINLVMLDGASDMMGFSVVTQASGELTTTVRFGGPLPDSNFWGRHLALGLPLAVALALRAVRERRRVAAALWFAAVAVLPVGMYLTQSRGTYLAAVVGIVFFLLLADRTVRLRGLWLIPAAAGLALLPGVGDRFLALVEDLSSDGATAGVDPSVLGRSAAQEIAWQMFAERPLTGFGVGSYAGLVQEYAGRVKTAVADPTDATHNLYAELAAETGVIGLIGWVVLVVGLSGLVLRWLLATRDVAQRRLAAAVLGGLVAWSAASVFLHLAYFRTFGLLVVLAAVICSQREPDPRPIDGRGLVRSLSLMVPVVVLAALVAAGTSTALSRDEVRVSAQLVAVPSGTPDALSAWPMDVRSRQTIMPTLAALFDSGVPDTRYIGDPVRGVVTVHVTATDPAAVRAMLRAAEIAARDRLEEFGMTSSFRVVMLGTPDITQGRDHTPAALMAGAAAGVGVLILGWGVQRRRAGRPRGRAAEPPHSNYPLTTRSTP
ncbi:O-antigen ligase family protein [Rhodococcus sp. IEGM 1408]|uniref:O-antigen ligase family protein n=1 Tax=Rhodococcus sp. IEGM 1408 TaxID=3082220 RepID=UPI002954B7F9|nr:O-antigen ligase family protein [Rhodococcus sp. IEGM 1408]MDV7999968.1 O-antigen ligase family protein [Rhodococcus sp. IEGM 1408]